MGQRFTREQLYALVWERPRTALAKELGISDVAISKLCRKARVPVPGQGYWRQLGTGKALIRPALPVRLPGHPRTFGFGDEAYSHFFWPGRESLDAPIEPEVFAERIEAQVEAALECIGPIPFHKNLKQPHASVAELLKDEEERRKAAAGKAWTLRNVRFDSTLHQRQLRILDSLAHALSVIYSACHVHAHTRFERGTGERYSLELRLDLGPRRLILRFMEPADKPSAGQSTTVTTTLQLTQLAPDRIRQEWMDSSTRKLETQLQDIVQGVLRHAELQVREAAQWHYEQRIEDRQKRLQEAAREKEQAYAQLLAVQASERRRRRAAICRLARDAARAREIRDLIVLMRSHPERSQPTDAALEAWCREALAVADSLDPLNRPLQEMICGTNAKGDA